MDVPIPPPVLRPGSRLAVLSPSAGLADVFAARFDRAFTALRERFGVEAVMAPHAARSNDWLRDHPEARAADVHWALQDPAVDGLLCAIGGDDQVRLIPYLDIEMIRAHPKVLMGYSDNTVLHLAWQRAGVVSFYGPGILAGFDENGGVWPHTEQSVRATLFSTDPVGPLHPAPEWTEEHLDWHDESVQRPRRRWPGSGWLWLGGGEAPVEGALIGGCVEVLAMALGSPLWPTPAEFAGAVLVLETSEEAPTVTQVRYMLRAFAAAGVFERLGAVLLGRPMDNSQLRTFALYDGVVAELALAGRPDLPVVAGLDVGHTIPHTVVPLGAVARVDPVARRISVVGPAVRARP